MSEFSLEWSGAGSLASALEGPIKKMSIPDIRNGLAFSLMIWRRDGEGIKFISKMHDLNDREEVEVLSIEPVNDLLLSANVIDLPEDFRFVVRAEKLTVEEKGGIIAESGISLHFLAGRELLILSGQFPCSITVRGLPDFQLPFDPEWPVEKYSRSALG